MTVNLNHVANQVTTTGSDTNIGLTFKAKGTGSFTFGHFGNESYPGYVFTGSSSTVTTMTFSSAGITMAGFSQDLPFTLTSKGISPVTLATGYGEHFKIGRTNSDTNPIVNYWQLSGSRTNEGVMMYALGSDTNISTFYYTKGTGEHVFNTGGTNLPQFRIAHTASSVNYLQATGATTFNAPTLSAQGTFSDINISLVPKGTGVVTTSGTGIQLKGSTSGYVGLKGAAAAGATTYTLPAADGTSGQVLTTNGSGDLSWAASGGATAAAVSDQSNTSTGYFSLPLGTTAQRPTTPQSGAIRMNSTTGAPEWYDSSSNSWTKFADPFQYTVTYLVIAGGGGGGGYYYAGGGGAGGTLTSTTALSAGTAYTVTVGAAGAGGGGSAQGGTGGNSVFGSITTIGGGGGGAWNTASASSGGSGGGGSFYAASGNASGTSGQGYAGSLGSGYPSYGTGGGGGGGGAGAAAPNNYGSSTAGAGGIGISSSISGSAVLYGGGGGGGSYNGSKENGAAWTYGGGQGASPGTDNQTAGATNKGGGGGGAYGGGGANGGSGIVIISYSGAQRGTGGTVTSVGGNTIHTFTSSGTFTA